LDAVGCVLGDWLMVLFPSLTVEAGSLRARYQSCW